MSQHTVKQWILATRPWSFPASLMPVIVTTAYLLWTEADVNFWIQLYTLLNVVVFHAAGNTWSDYFDYKKGVDGKETMGSRTIVDGVFDAETIKKFAIVLLAVAMVMGIGLAMMTTWKLLYFGILAAAFTLLYPALKYNALGDLDIIITYGILPTLGTSMVITGQIVWSVLWLSVPLGLITDGILHSNNTRDTKNDTAANIKTFASLIGLKASVILYCFEVYFPFAWVLGCCIAGIMPWTAMFCIIAFKHANDCAQTMRHYGMNQDQKINNLDQRTAQLQLMFSMMLAIGFAVDVVIKHIML